MCRLCNSLHNFWTSSTTAVPFLSVCPHNWQKTGDHTICPKIWHHCVHSVIHLWCVTYLSLWQSKHFTPAKKISPELPLIGMYQPYSVTTLHGETLLYQPSNYACTARWKKKFWHSVCMQWIMHTHPVVSQLCLFYLLKNTSRRSKMYHSVEAFAWSISQKSKTTKLIFKMSI